MDDGKVLAILQARMSSTRLPGKVLLPILGRPMLGRQLERLKHSIAIDELVVATSVYQSDDGIAALCAKEDVACFRGSLNDVLDRFVCCARIYKASHIVRLTGDCPLIDPELVDALVQFYLGQQVDYASNCRPPTLPDGLDAEIFTMEALESASREANDPFSREHVVPFILNQPKRFSTANWEAKENLSHLRWTVDEQEDFDFVARVYEALYLDNPSFGFEDVLTLVRCQPELAQLNSHHKRNQGGR